MKITLLESGSSHVSDADIIWDVTQPTSDILIELSERVIRVWEQNRMTGLRCLYAASVTISKEKMRKVSGRDWASVLPRLRVNYTALPATRPVKQL